MLGRTTIRFRKGIMLVDLLNLRIWDYYYGEGQSWGYDLTLANLLTGNISGNRTQLISKWKTSERFFSTIEGISEPRVLSLSPSCVGTTNFSGNEYIEFRTCDGGYEYIQIYNDVLFRHYRHYYTRPSHCLDVEREDYEFIVERHPPIVSEHPREITGISLFQNPAFYYQVYSLNHLANQLRNKTVFWNAFYLTPFWQIFTLNQDNTIAFYHTRIPYNFLVYFTSIEADSEQVNCCVNPQIVRDRPLNEEIGLNISIPQLPINNTFTGGNEGQFSWLTPEQSSLLNPYNYVNPKLTTHKPFFTPLYEKFYRRVDKQVFLEPVLAYVKGGQVFIIGQYKGIFAYTLPEHADKVFLAVYRESANELILAIGEDLIMADVIEYEDVSLGTLTSQENPFVFYKTHITKTGEVEEEGDKPIVRFVDLP
ncbi:MAG: hypothetical protein QXT86_13275 [Archaeoglobaceae archaeon]